MLKDTCPELPNDGITYDTPRAYMGDSGLTSMKDGDEQVDTGAATPNTNTFGSAASLSRPSTYFSAKSQQKQDSLVETMNPGYPPVTEEAFQMESSLKTALDLRVNGELNYHRFYSNS